MLFFGRKKRPFGESAKFLADGGFTEEYIEMLRGELAEIKKPADIAMGRNYLINALIITGALTEAYDIFLQLERDDLLKKLDKSLQPNLLHNVIFSLFARDKFKEAERLYKEYNAIVLHEHTDTMKRTLAIHECISGRYENAVTVLAKLLDSNCRFLDFCLVKTALKLDMFERAAELAGNFDSYRGELGDEAKKLKAKIFQGLSPKKKTAAIKNKRRK